MDVSIIVVNWNTCAILRNCLRSVLEHTDHTKHEVIVVDNNSTDNSVQMVKEQFPQVILIENSDNRGFAAATNQGIAVAKGRHVLLLNSDTIVLDNAIAKAASFLDSRPEVGVTGPRVLNPDMTSQPSCFMFPSIVNILLSSSYLYKIFPRSRFFGRERMTWWDKKDIREVDVVRGCFMLVRREAIEDVGLMDERFFMYGEETDWCYRFKRAGWKVVFAPVAEIIHIGGASSSGPANEMTLQLRGSILQFMAKHRTKPAYVLACILTGLFFAIRIPFWCFRLLTSRENRSFCRSKVKLYSKGLVRLLSGSDGLCVKAQD